MTLDSTFQIASCTKLMTTICALQCVERGLFTLDSSEDLARLLPELASPKIIVGKDDKDEIIVKSASQKITMRKLLTHTSGYAYPLISPMLTTWCVNNGIPLDVTSPGKVVHMFGFPLLFEPGEKWQYGVGLDWAGKMIEKANNGMRLETYMRENIWGPLGMENTTFDLDKHEHVARHLVEPAIRDSNTDVLTPGERPSADPIEDCYGGIGVYSTATDYIKILASLLKNNGKLLRTQTVDEMFRPQLSRESLDAWLEWSQVSGVTRAMTGTDNPKKDIDWGLGGMLTMEDDSDTGAKKGTLAWGGFPNLYWVSYFDYIVYLHEMTKWVHNSGSIVREVSVDCTPAKYCLLETQSRWRCTGSSGRRSTKRKDHCNH